MKVRWIELKDFKKFTGTVRVDGIADGVNLLVGRNEMGKSTLLTAFNAVVFEKAKSTSREVKAFRHIRNGTVPEVKLGFDLDGKSWTIWKRFAGQPGRALLSCSDGRRFEDEAADDELQRLLRFSGGSRGGDPGIWGTLWVRQGQSFETMDIGEDARRALQSCLENQVGLVTGGRRGRNIPDAVKKALEVLENNRGPKGPYKDAVVGLAAASARAAELEIKRLELFDQMDALARVRRELRGQEAEWDAEAHRLELDEARAARIAAATRASELATAKAAASQAEERAGYVRKEVAQRATLISEIESLQTQVNALQTQVGNAQTAKAEAETVVESRDRHLAELREKARINGEQVRHLNRIRNVVGVQAKIDEHEAAIGRSSELAAESEQLSEAIGRNGATAEVLKRVETAATGFAAAEAALNAVATTVSLDIDRTALGHVSIDDKSVDQPKSTRPIVARTVIGIEGVGKIAVEPQIKNRDQIVAQLVRARDEQKMALEAAGADDIEAARLNAARRTEIERRLAEISREIIALAPGDKTSKLASGLDALRSRAGELRGWLEAELVALGLASRPEPAEIERQIAAAHSEGPRLAADIAAAEAALEGPKASVARTDKILRELEQQLAGLNATLAGKQAALTAGRSTASDDVLARSSDELNQEAATQQAAVAARERIQGEAIEAIDARIRRLEGAADNHVKDVGRLGLEIARLSALIEANEGVGVEEALEVAKAEVTRLDAAVKAYQEETAVLRLLGETLQSAESEAKTLYLSPVETRIAPYLKMLFPDAGIVLDENLGLTALAREGTQEDFDILSGGTQEQIAVLTRLAFAELLLSQGRPATVILDDALVFSDDERIERMFDVLMRAGEHVQILVLTCRGRLFKRLGATSLQISATRGDPGS